MRKHITEGGRRPTDNIKHKIIKSSTAGVQSLGWKETVHQHKKLEHESKKKQQISKTGFRSLRQKGSDVFGISYQEITRAEWERSLQQKVPGL